MRSELRKLGCFRRALSFHNVPSFFQWLLPTNSRSDCQWSRSTSQVLWVVESDDIYKYRKSQFLDLSVGAKRRGASDDEPVTQFWCCRASNSCSQRMHRHFLSEVFQGWKIGIDTQSQHTYTRLFSVEQAFLRANMAVLFHRCASWQSSMFATFKCLQQRPLTLLKCRNR